LRHPCRKRLPSSFHAGSRCIICLLANVFRFDQGRRRPHKPFAAPRAGAIEFAAHAIAFVLPVAQLPNLSDADEFWPVYQQYGRLVDSLPNGSGETVAIFMDYLASEARIQIPSPCSTDLGRRIAPPENVTVWACMSAHDAKVLRSRLTKRGLVPGPESTRIFTAYDREFDRHPELCAATVSFFANLADHIDHDNERLIVATIENSD